MALAVRFRLAVSLHVFRQRGVNNLGTAWGKRHGFPYLVYRFNGLWFYSSVNHDFGIAGPPSCSFSSFSRFGMP
jgi:hypothetical protein